ncbi:class I tRNA ligase family protein, partial [Iodobacter sp.]|uniref:class I tRNA ligase family protein n=1 Tax=Iodobacter sp. TaxID=1915058 RepID=UPI0025D94710
EFVWNDYCDWYIELAKVQLQSGNEAEQRATRRTLVRVLEATLRMAHPIIPFITEELWQVVAPLANAKTTESIMVADWPVADLTKVNEAANAQVDVLKALAFAVRNLRGEMGLSPSQKTPLLLEGGDELQQYAAYLMPLAKLASVAIVAKLPEDDAPVAVAGSTRLMLKVEIDKTAESARLTKEIGKLAENLEKIKAKLEKPGYLDKAPAHLVEKDQALVLDQTEKLAKLQSQLAKLQ